MVSKFSQSLSRELTFLFRLIPLGISAPDFLGDLDHPTVIPDSRGFPKILEGLLRDYELSPRKFDSCLLLLLSQE